MCTAHIVHEFPSAQRPTPLEPVAIHGLHWYDGPTPIAGIEKAIDVRRIHCEEQL